MKPELNLLSTAFKEIESKYRGIKKQIEVIADRCVEEEVTSEDERITNNLKSGDEIKQRYLETLQKYASYQKELSAPQLQNTTESTAALGEVATAVRQMAQNMAAKPKVPITGLERLSTHHGMDPEKRTSLGKKSSTTGQTNTNKTKMSSSNAAVGHCLEDLGGQSR